MDEIQELNRQIERMAEWIYDNVPINMICNEGYKICTEHDNCMNCIINYFKKED